MTYTQAIEKLGAEEIVTRKAFQEGTFVFHGYPFVQVYKADEKGIGQAFNASSLYNTPYKAGGILCKKSDVIEIGYAPTKEDLMADDWEVFEVK